MSEMGRRSTKDLVLELMKTTSALRDAAILVKFPDATGEYVPADYGHSFEGQQRILERLNAHVQAGGVPIGIVGLSGDGLVVTRPFSESPRTQG